MKRFASAGVSAVLLGLLLACGARPPAPAPPAAEDRPADPPPAGAQDGTKDVAPASSLDSGIKGGVNSVSVSPDGRYVVAMGTGDDKNLQVWDVAARKRASVLDNRCGSVLPVAIAPDGKSFAFALGDGTGGRLCALPSGKELRNLQRPADRPFYVPWHLAFSPKGDLLVAACNDPAGRNKGALLGFDPGTGEVRFTWPQEDVQGATALSGFFDGGRKIATAGEKGEVKVWDVPGGKAKALERVFRDKVVALAASPDGKSLVAVPLHGQFQLYDLTTGRAKALDLKGGWVPALFLRDNTRIVCGDGGKESDLLVFDVKSGKRTHRMRGHTKTVWGLALTADGSTLVSGSEDGAIKVWDLTKLP
jgi:WD40 repeat protein